MDQFDNPTVKLNSSKLVIGNSNFTPGQLLAGRYRILRVLGRGGMGVVLEVENVLIGKQFALKLLDLQEDSSAALSRFTREAKLLSGLVHPNIVRALDFGLLDEAVPYVLMELVSGATLTQQLRQSGPMSEEEAIERFVPILEGLQYAHQNGVIHRDMKPGNIMLMGDGSGVVVPKILDFGIAACTESASEALTRTGEIIGTPLYMSPEQVSGGAIKASSDIYSLGCVMFEALTGAPPFNGRTALETMMLHKSEQAPSLKSASLGNVFSERMETTIARMLAKESEDRFQSCDQVIAALTRPETGREVVRNSEEDPLPILTLGRVAAVCAFLILAVAVTAFGAFVYFTDFSKSAKVAGEKVTPVEVSRAATSDISSDAMPMSIMDNLSPDEYVTKTSKGRHFDLSSEKNDLGEFEWVDSAGVAHKAGVRKNGKVEAFTVPYDCKLWYKPSSPILQKPYFMEKFNKAKLEGVILAFQHVDFLIPEGALSSCLHGMAHIPALYIDRTNLPDNAIDALQSLSDLKWFSMQSSTQSDFKLEEAEKISQSLNLKKLEVLNLNLNLTTLHKPFLQELAKDIAHKPPHLIALGLGRCLLDEEDFKNIGKLKDLKFLNIVDSIDPRRCSMARASEYLQSCRHLGALAVSSEHLDVAAAKKIVAMKVVRTIYYRNFQSLSPEAKDLLTKGGLTLIRTDDQACGFEPWSEPSKF